MQSLTSRSKSFKDVLSKAKHFAQVNFPVLLVGETGAGKEVLARQIHLDGIRSKEAFVPVNCAAIPHGLFESELFGYEKGSFSGALLSSKGLIRAAHGGTLFLDEIGELDLSLQVKLLRFLDSGEVRSVGSQKVEQVDVRIIAATNVNLYEAVAKKMFRLDLLERLSVLYLQVPPLRERKEDFPILIESLVNQLDVKIENGVADILVSYAWPGNVRQLKNVLIRSAVLGAGHIKRDLIQSILLLETEQTEQMKMPTNLGEIEGKLEDIEKQIIAERLRRYGGNKKRTAKDLGIAKSTLHEKLKRWNGQPVSIASEF